LLFRLFALPLEGNVLNGECHGAEQPKVTGDRERRMVQARATKDDEYSKGDYEGIKGRLQTQYMAEIREERQSGVAGIVAGVVATQQ
jgi:hypothetical protein